MAEFWNEDQILAQLKHPGQRIFLLYDKNPVLVDPTKLSSSLTEPNSPAKGYIWLENRDVKVHNPHSDYRVEKTDQSVQTASSFSQGPETPFPKVQSPGTDQSVHKGWSKSESALSKPGEWELLRIGVRPEFRASGLGHRLMQAGLRGLAGSVMLEVAANNRSAIKLYEDFGFLEIHRRKNYYRDSDALIMKLQLGEIQ
ncbi:MAG: GNAT family N-acetyltransferase [Leptospiraceae bacterium]|nr:GNAT family N-acetyltransferase [Leptospiraceae bacterium]